MAVCLTVFFSDASYTTNFSSETSLGTQCPDDTGPTESGVSITETMGGLLHL